MQKILYTKAMELRHAVQCIEPIFNNETQKIEAVFLPCNFQDEQKWKFLSLSQYSYASNHGKLSNVASGQCLTFNNKEKANTQRKKLKKKNKVLSMLTNIVKDSIEKMKSPHLFKCDSNKYDVDVFQSQIWVL